MDVLTKLSLRYEIRNLLTNQINAGIDHPMPNRDGLSPTRAFDVTVERMYRERLDRIVDQVKREIAGVKKEADAATLEFIRQHEVK